MGGSAMLLLTPLAEAPITSWVDKLRNGQRLSSQSGQRPHRAIGAADRHTLASVETARTSPDSHHRAVFPLSATLSSR
jgi:hypothetical protein